MTLLIMRCEYWELLAHGSEHVVFINREIEPESILYKKVLRVRLNRQIKSTNVDMNALEFKLSQFILDNYIGSTYGPISLIVELCDKLVKILHDKVIVLGIFDSFDLHPSAILVENLFLSSKIVYEIKPKWTGCLVTPSTHNKLLCSYCSHTKRLKDFSKFCPAHLFSGELHNVYNSLLKYPSIRHICSKHLLILSYIIFHDGILDILKRMHSMNCSFIQRALRESIPTAEDYVSRLDQYLKDPSSDPLLEFLTTSSVKDCSLFIAVHEHASPAHKTIDIFGTRISYDIKLIDIDIKSVSRVHKYIRDTLNSCLDPKHKLLMANWRKCKLFNHFPSD